MILAILAGLGLSLLGLVPGLHLIAWLPAIFLMLHGDQALLTGAVFVGSATVLQILHATYHPVASSMLASADVPAKLAFHGFGNDVVAHWKQACLTGLTALLVLSLMIILPHLTGYPVASIGMRLLKPLMPPLLITVLGLIVLRSGKPLRALLVCLGAGTLGFVGFTILKDTAMTPLLGGLFGLPASLALLLEEPGDPIPTGGQWPAPVVMVSHDDIRGVVAGMVTGLMAGVGTGSLVALLRQDGMDPMRYVRISAAADMGNNVFALLLFAAAGTTRSGVAAALAEGGTPSDPITLLIVPLAVILGTWFGSLAVTRLEKGYRTMANVMPVRLIGMALTVVTLAGCWHAAGLGGLVLAGSAALLSSLAKSWHTPNQALLTTLMGPALISGLGLTVWARGLLAI